MSPGVRPSALFRGVLCLMTVCASSAAGLAGAQAIAPDQVQYNDVLLVELRQGGQVEGRAVATDGLSLILVIDEERTRIEFAILGALELVSREGAMPLPVVSPPPGTDPDADVARQRRAKRRAAGLAIASFLLPGTGQFVNRQPALGVTYLAGIILLDTVIALSLIVNGDPTVATVLGIVDLAARVSSAELARSEAMRALRQVQRGPGVGRGTTHPVVAWFTPGRDGTSWSLAVGVSLRL